ncbi:MAG TPA: ABC transporter ATP-binding protein [Acidimicrobiia bacterium]|nr:ABC transporter ATP-binding protein [Acidimicrobiia bacterium]
MSGIWAGYGETTVLWGVDLEVAPGSVVALLGPNGAGKTTLLRVASGIVPPRQGTIRTGGQDVTGRPPEVLAAGGLCQVPEGRSIFPSLTVRENLVLQSFPRQEKEGIARAVEAFPILGPRLTQPAGTLSGGQQQMLALARAYIRRPPLVLLDEVSMGLAPIVVDEIYAFLTRLVEQGSALLLVEQYVDRVLELADCVYLLQKGAMAWTGAAADLDQSDVLGSYLGAG